MPPNMKSECSKHQLENSMSIRKVTLLNSNWSPSSPNTEAENDTTELRSTCTPKRMEIQPRIVLCRYINQINGKNNYGAIIKCTLSQDSRRSISQKLGVGQVLLGGLEVRSLKLFLYSFVLTLPFRPVFLKLCCILESPAELLKTY